MRKIVVALLPLPVLATPAWADVPPQPYETSNLVLWIIIGVLISVVAITFWRRRKR